jgi:hypothetical protein
VLAIDTVTVDRYRRTMAFVQVGDTVVKEERIGESLHAVLRPADL